MINQDLDIMILMTLLGTKQQNYSRNRNKNHLCLLHVKDVPVCASI
jgi:hypothetical protein